MKVKKFKVLVGDFETTVYKGQTHTEVWASALVEMYTEDVKILHSIDETFDYLKELNQNVIVYYHNLKFDGSFWLSYLIIKKHFKQAIDPLTGTEEELLQNPSHSIAFEKDRWMSNNTFKYSISDMGQWYTIIIKVNNHYIELRDSLKLLPFSVRRIGDSFATKHKKLDMEYTGFRYAGCGITDKEKEYIANDVLVVKEALEIMYNAGHKQLTIGACCLDEYKKIIGEETYRDWFPNIYEISIDEKHGTKTAGDWVRKSYKGGWCYLAKGKENKKYYNGTTADVNSLYPSMMSAESGNRYPTGEPTFWTGNIPDKLIGNRAFYWFVRIRTKFYLKDGYLPFIQLKGNLLYNGTECLTTSDVYDPETKRYYDKYRNKDGELVDAKVELTLTMVDYALIQEHYELVDLEILDGCYFNARLGIFDDYMEKYKQKKLTTKGAQRELAKLFLNNLYGKMASSMDSDFKYAFAKTDKSLGFIIVRAKDKKPGYIPAGSAITSYARNFTIRAAQKNYHGIDKPGFIYADTDSIHCDLQPEEIQGIVVHDKNFCCWKLESCWDVAYFTRQKTYIEHITAENLTPIDKPYYNVKCAGMPDRCKDLFVKSLEHYQPTETDTFSEEQLAVINAGYTLDDFKVGLTLPGKLLPKRIHGGILLVETTYEMR